MPWDDDTIRDFASPFVQDEVFGSDNGKRKAPPNGGRAGPGKELLSRLVGDLPYV
jgi:hypothetical protein